MAMSDRPTRLDPSTGLTRPGQGIDPRPARPLRVPQPNMPPTPTPPTGQAQPATGMGPGMGAPTGRLNPPSISHPAVSLPTTPRGGLQTGMTGPVARAGNQPVMSESRSSGQAAGTAARDYVRGVVRGNGGRPAETG